MTGERVLVTGGCGYVGRRLVDQLLRDGHEVAVIDDLTRGRPRPSWATEPRLTLLESDIRDVQETANCVAVVNPTRVFHLAAIHFIPACNAEPARAVDVNVTGTESVLQACRAVEGLESVVIISSAAVYAPDHEAHHEDSALRPIDIYGLTKLWDEQLCQLFHADSDVPVGIARLFNVFGPGETNPHLIPAILEQVAKGTELHLGNLDTRRDYVYVDDVVKALLRLSAVAPSHGLLCCNVGSETAIDGHAVVAAVADLVGRQLTVTTDEGRVRASDRPVLLSDCSHARDVLGWRSETTFVDGLRNTLLEPMADRTAVG